MLSCPFCGATEKDEYCCGNKRTATPNHSIAISGNEQQYEMSEEISDKSISANVSAIPEYMGCIVRDENVRRITIEYILEKRNEIFEVLDNLYENYYVIKSGPKIIDFPKVSTEIGLMVIEI